MNSKEDIQKRIDRLKFKRESYIKTRDSLLLLLSLEESFDIYNEGKVIMPFRQDIKALQEAVHVLSLKESYANEVLGQLFLQLEGK